MSDAPSRLNRSILQQFLPNLQAVKAFEDLINQLDTDIPAQIAALSILYASANAVAVGADAKSTEALELSALLQSQANVLSVKPNTEDTKQDNIPVILQVNASDLCGDTISNEVVNSTLQKIGVSSASPTFVAGDKYLIVDASGNIHVSSLGPAS